MILSKKLIHLIKKVVYMLANLLCLKDHRKNKMKIATETYKKKRQRIVNINENKYLLIMNLNSKIYLFTEEFDNLYQITNNYIR